MVFKAYTEDLIYLLLGFLFIELFISVGMMQENSLFGVIKLNKKKLDFSHAFYLLK